MKHQRKWISFLMVLAMLLSAMSTVFAVGTDGSLPISNAPMNNESITRNSPVQHDWTAKWIWAADNTSRQNWIVARKTFTIADIDEISDQVAAMISIDSKYWMWINGEEVIRDGGVKRGPTYHDSWMEYVDITKYLKEGTNTIAILGWFFSGSASDRYYSYKSSGKAGLLFEADLGNGQTVASDNTWKVKKHAAYQESSRWTANYRLMEGDIFYKAADAGNLVKNGVEAWMEPSFNDSAWPAAVEYGVAGAAPWNKLYERSIPQLYYSDEYYEFENSEVYAAYVDNYTTEQITLVMKVPGGNRQINPVLELEAQSTGQQIDINTDGNQPLRAHYFTVAGYQLWECKGWLSAQEMTFTIPAGVKIKGLYFYKSGYNSQQAGSFKTDDDFMSKIWQESYNTLQICMRDNFMDCPDRERAQWWGDVTAQMLQSFYALDSNGKLLYRKGVDTVLGWTYESSARMKNVLRTVVPSNNEEQELPHQQLYGVTGFWNYYLYTGEKDFLEQVYQPSMTYLMLWTMNANGMPNYRNGTWNWVDWGSNSDAQPLQFAWYYYAATSVMRMAEELGIENTETAALQGRIDSIKANFDRLYWKENYQTTGANAWGPGNAYYNSTSNKKPDDRVNAVAAASGLADPEKYADIMKVLGSFDGTNKLQIKNASPYLENMVLEAMYKMGYANEANARIRDRYNQFYTDKWTTLAEFFYDSGGMGGAATQNHAWTSHPIVHLGAYVGGVKPTEAGYKAWEVRPQLGDMTSFENTVPAEIGEIKVNINKTSDSLAMTVVSPGNDAKIWVPVQEDQSAVQVNGSTAEVLGRKTVYNDEYMVFAITEAGSYAFETVVKADMGVKADNAKIVKGANANFTVYGDFNQANVFQIKGTYTGNVAPTYTLASGMTCVAGPNTPKLADGVIDIIVTKANAYVSGTQELVTFNFPTTAAGSITVNLTSAIVSGAEDITDDDTTYEVPATISPASATVTIYDNMAAICDLNGDGRVSAADLSLAMKYYGTKVGDADWDKAAKCDVTGDGSVDMADLIMILANYTN